MSSYFFPIDVDLDLACSAFVEADYRRKSLSVVQITIKPGSTDYGAEHIDFDL